MKLKCVFIAAVFFCSSFFNASSQEGFIGEIRMFAGTFTPRNWAMCDGQLLSISRNTALFSILGATYGGDGRSTFRLPDLRGRTAVHPGYGPGLPSVSLGQKSGTTSLTLPTNSLPAHNHSGYINVSDTKGDDFYTSNGYMADSSTVSFQQFTNTPPSGNKTIQGVQTNTTGLGLSISKRSPFTGINYIICLSGIFPARN